MKPNIISQSTVMILVLIAFVAGGVLRTAYVAAQEASSTEQASSTETASSSGSGSVMGAATSSDDVSSSPETPTPPTASVSAPALTLVHTAGRKYVDYCTDGVNITAYPGDPAIDSNFDKPDAPIPSCPSGQKWDHTSGMSGYDTASGDLEVGQYAQQPDGSYVIHYPAMTYTDATSTVQWSDRIATMTTDPSTTPLPAEVTVTSQQ
jgi:archaellin